MGEHGWRTFLEAEGVDDWVVLHGGPAAVFRVGSLAEAAALAGAMAEAPAVDDRILMTVAADRVTVRLTRDVWHLEPDHVALARAVSAVARDHGASADRSAVQEVQLAVASKPAETDLGFWRAVLGYTRSADDAAVDPLGHGSTVWMQGLDVGRPLRHAMHVDVSLAREEAERRLEEALAAGGRIVDASEAPRWWTLSDRAGNRVCIASWPDGAGRAEPDPHDT
ncbi:MAG: VOC family protein [Acidimicrobiia bacterium]|nr:VOC family protein [Acidimicrobiia bacterium]